ncbi:hypothetical protein H7J93_04985 [Mycobacterium barrassiae]|uniref:hypothetical protein n=1 Tax=Mycobacterium barrassiae TaxID=319709 RepID=UPI002265C8D0|nr:hypothetical protein [Mycobacterium barrassiae]MCV7298990.1 hypothetical protein [Mycobacterium barrassiae]
MVAPQLPTTANEVFEAVSDAVSERAIPAIHIVDYDTPDGSRPAGMARVSTTDTEELTAELDGAIEWLGVASDEILLAALARTIARTLGEGTVAVDIASQRGSMLDAVPLTCATARQVDATEMLRSVSAILASATESAADGMSEMYFNYLGEVPEDAVPVPVQETPPGLGHALEMRVYRTGGLVHVDWWYDTSQFEPYTIEELAEQFPRAFYEMTTDALPAG